MSNNRNDILKVIGLVSMTFDHIGMLLFPHIFWFRVIGRIAFPIFAYHISIGVKNTKNIVKYAFRILIFACLTQPIFKLVVGSGLNIMFDLFIGIVVLGLLKRNRKWDWVFAAVVSLVWAILNQGYGWYGTGCMIAFYYMDEDVKLASLVFIAISVVAALFSPNYVQGFAVLALPFILFKTKVRVEVPKYFFYAYYPVHLLAIHFAGVKFF